MNSTTTSNKRYKVDNENNESDNNTTTNYNDIPFFKLWRYKVISKVIFEFSKLYKDHRQVTFNDLESLRNYDHREYITTLKFLCGHIDLLKGDLPENGALRELDLSECTVSISSWDVIPQSVEIIHFNSGPPQVIGNRVFRGNIYPNASNKIQLSELTSILSVNTVSNIKLDKPYINNNIPTNITSISIVNIIDSVDFFEQIKFHQAFKRIDLSQGINIPPTTPPLPETSTIKSFIPQSITGLKIFYDEKYSTNIPPSVTKLYLKISGICSFKKGIIPFGVKELTLFGEDYSGIILEAESLPNSIKKLTIHCGKQKIGLDNNEFVRYSIPKSVVDFDIHFVQYPKFFNGLFPHNLTKLVIERRRDSLNKPPIVSQLPSTLKFLKMNGTVIINKSK